MVYILPCIAGLYQSIICGNHYMESTEPNESQIMPVCNTGHQKSMRIQRAGCVWDRLLSATEPPTINACKVWSTKSTFLVYIYIYIYSRSGARVQWLPGRQQMSSSTRHLLSRPISSPRQCRPRPRTRLILSTKVCGSSLPLSLTKMLTFI